MAKKIVTALEITDDYIKLAQAEESAQESLLTAVIIRKITARGEKEIAQQLSSLIYENKIKIKNLTVVIPRQLLTIRILRLPSADMNELASMVALQAAKQIPYNPEDIISDFKIIEKDTQGFSKVLLAIAHKEVISKYINILGQVGLRAKGFVISPQALAGWLEHLKNKTKNIPEAAAIINVDTLTSDLIIVSDTQLVFSRSIAFNAQEMALSEVKSFLEELKHSFSTYRQEKLGTEVSKIILTGASNYFLSLIDGLKNELGLEAETEEPEKHLKIAPDGLFPAGGKNKSVSLTNIFGVTLMGPEASLNLMPSNIRHQQENEARKRTYIFSSIFIILIAGLLASLILLKIFQKESYLTQLDFQLSKTLPQTQNIQKMMRQLEVIKQRLERQGLTIDVLYELYKLVPNSISLSILNLDENGMLTLQGTAVAMSEVFNLVNTLEKSPFFQNVEVKYTSKRKVGDKEITDFQISASLSRPGPGIGKK